MYFGIKLCIIYIMLLRVSHIIHMLDLSLNELFVTVVRFRCVLIKLYEFRYFLKSLDNLT